MHSRFSVTYKNLLLINTTTIGAYLLQQCIIWLVAVVITSVIID